MKNWILQYADQSSDEGSGEEEDDKVAEFDPVSTPVSFYNKSELHTTPLIREYSAFFCCILKL